MSSILHRIKNYYLQLTNQHIYGRNLNQITDRYVVDPLIHYPCYKSMDEYIDIQQLLSLDKPLTAAIQNYINTTDYRQMPFRTGPMTLKFWGRKITGANLIALTEHIAEYSYLEISDPDKWRPSKHATQFDFLLKFIQTLPFKRTARIMLIFDIDGQGVTAHRDHCMQDVCHEFIWFSSNLKKKFYVYNKFTQEKLYITSHSAWFDTVNQFHGAEAVPGLNFSVRVDGEFTDEFRKKIPQPAFNLASTPAFWTCTC